TLAELILTEKCIGKKVPLQLIQGVIISLAVSRAACGARLRPEWQLRVIRHWRRRLFIEESLEADLLNVADEFGCRAKRRLLKKSYSVSRGGLCFNEMHSTDYYH